MQEGHSGPHRPRNEHHCHARGCLVPTKPEMLMCGRHWFMVPAALRRAVWMTYREGQCDDMQPSAEWHAAADAAIAAVAAKEASKASAPKGPTKALSEAPAAAQGEEK